MVSSSSNSHPIGPNQNDLSSPSVADSGQRIETSIFKRVLATPDADLISLGNQWCKISTPNTKLNEYMNLISFIDDLKRSLEFISPTQTAVVNELEYAKPSDMTNVEILVHVKQQLLETKSRLIDALVMLSPKELDSLEKYVSTSANSKIYENLFDTVRAKKIIKNHNFFTENNFPLRNLAFKLIAKNDLKAVREIEMSISDHPIGFLPGAKQRASLIYTMFVVHSESGDLKAARMIIDELPLDLQTHAFNVLNASFDKYMTTGQYDKAKQLADAEPDSKKQGLMLVQLFNKYMSLSAVDQAQAIAKKIQDPEILAQILHQLPREKL